MEEVCGVLIIFKQWNYFPPYLRFLVWVPWGFKLFSAAGALFGQVSSVHGIEIVKIWVRQSLKVFKFGCDGLTGISNSKKSILTFPYIHTHFLSEGDILGLTTAHPLTIESRAKLRTQNSCENRPVEIDIHDVFFKEFL